jgi:hypothetical protein
LEKNKILFVVVINNLFSNYIFFAELTGDGDADVDSFPTEGPRLLLDLLGEFC